MKVGAFSTPARPGWRWRIINYSDETVEESREGFPTIAEAVAKGTGRAATLNREKAERARTFYVPRSATYRRPRGGPRARNGRRAGGIIGPQRSAGAPRPVAHPAQVVSVVDHDHFSLSALRISPITPAVLALSIPGIPGPGLLIALVGVFLLMPESRWLRTKYVALAQRYPKLSSAAQFTRRRAVHARSTIGASSASSVSASAPAPPGGR